MFAHPYPYSLPLFSWSYKKKWIATAIVSAFTFITPIASSMVAPATEQIAREFGITNTVIIAMTTSVFVLAFGEHFVFSCFGSIC